MSKERNNCNTCPHRLKVNGDLSGHNIACAIGMVSVSNHIRAHQEASGNLTKFVNQVNGETYIKLNEYAAKEGWLMWPLYFNPIWVKCYIPIAGTQPLTKDDLSIMKRIPKELTGILLQAPEGWAYEALMDYFNNNTPVEVICNAWEQYKASQDDNKDV
jgi:hypothetical protein